MGGFWALLDRLERPLGTLEVHTCATWTKGWRARKALLGRIPQGCLRHLSCGKEWRKGCIRSQLCAGLQFSRSLIITRSCAQLRGPVSVLRGHFKGKNEKPLINFLIAFWSTLDFRCLFWFQLRIRFGPEENKVNTHPNTLPRAPNNLEGPRK